MIFPILLWLLILSALGLLLWREHHACQFAKATGRFVERAKTRYKRRVLGIVLLFLLLLTLQVGEYLADSFDLRGRLLFYLMCFIQLVWVMILAARDINELAGNYAKLRTELTLSALRELEREMERRDKGTDEELIPPLKFPPRKSPKE